MAESKSRFGALKTFRQQERNAEPDNAGASTEERENPSLEAKKGKGRPTGKRSNPDYEPTTVYLRKTTKRSASRLLEDTNARKDLSDLIEDLLLQWSCKHSQL